MLSFNNYTSLWAENCLQYKNSMTLWEHPTSLLAAPSNTYIGQTAALFRAPLNTHTNNCAALFRLPTKQLRNAISSPFQAPNQTVTQRYQQPFSGPPTLQSQFIPTNHRLVCSDQSQTTHQPSKLNKRRPPGASKTSSFLLIQTCTTRLCSINIVTVGELKLLFQATLQYPTTLWNCKGAYSMLMFKCKKSQKYGHAVW